MKTLFSILIALLLSFGAALGQHARFTVNGKPVSGSRFEAFKLVNTGTMLMREHRINEAVVLLKRALLFDPMLAEAHSNLGVALARQGKVEEAADHFRTAIVDDRQLTAPRLNLASLYQSNGKLKDAVDTYKSFLTDFPDSKQAEAVSERLELLTAELERQTRAGASGGAHGDYYANVVATEGRKRWSGERMPLKVYIAPGDGLNGYRPQYDSILRNSFKEWETASKGKIRFQFVDSISKRPDISCKWLDNADELASSAEGGEAQVRSIFGSVVAAKVLLLVKDEQELPFTDNLIRTLCLHETGHALGLLGHSADPDDVLFSTTPIVEREQHLSERDKNTLAQLYAQDVDWAGKIGNQLDRATGGSSDRLISLGHLSIVLLGISIIVVYLIVRAVSNKGRKHRKK